MKILMLSWRGPGHPTSGGAEISSHEHAKAWIQAGHSVTLFTSHYKGAKKNEVIDKVTIIRRGRQIFGVQIEAFFWYLLGNHPNYDLVVDEFHGIPFFTPLYVKIKKLGWIHEVAKEVWWLNALPKPLNLIPGVVGTIFEPLVFRVLYKKIPFMTVSNSTREDLITWGIPSSNITVVANGVNLDIPNKLPKKEKSKTIVYLGSLTKDKGIEDALKVFKLLQGRIKDIHFWVIGKGGGDYLVYLKNIARDYTIFDQLTFWGYVSDSRKFNLLARAHIMINPSIREGWGLVNIEANSVGTPVVGYNVPGTKDSVLDGKTGYLCSLGDTQVVAAKVAELLEKEDDYKRFQKASLIWSNEFSWDKAGNKSLRLISSL